MGTTDLDLSAFDDPNPTPTAHAFPYPDPDLPSSTKLSEAAARDSPPKRPRTRKLPYRAANDLIQETKYKGRRTSRSNVGLDADALGLEGVSPDEEPSHEGKGSLLEGLSDDSEIDGERMRAVTHGKGDHGVGGDLGAEARQEDEEVVEREMVARLTAAEERDRLRAAAIRIQKDQYDAAVNMRIRLEPLAALARKLPVSEQRRNWEGAEHLQEVERSVLRALETLEDNARQKWASSWPGYEEGEKEEDGEFEGWRDEIMDQWGKKIAEATGKTPKGGYKTIDDSISGLTKAAFSSGKHLKKSQRVKESMELVGGGEMEEGLNKEMYDDGDLYRVLLREIIESGEGGGGGLRYARLSKGGKVKKKRDRMLAKGRRLKYDVQEKLVGFVTPVPLPDPGPLDEIVAAMFGKRGTVVGAP